VADADFDGTCLDVSSPKLLPSLLQSEGRGHWICIDLFAEEISAWQRIDPELDLRVEDATSLSFADDVFDHCVCISVIEHIGGGRDVDALAEIWRVLKPGGTLHLTTDVAVEPNDVFVGSRVYGDASNVVDERGVFFRHKYAPAELERLIATRPWDIVEREFAAMRNPRIETSFNDHAPWTYPLGPFLRVVCPSNFVRSSDPALIARAREGTAYIHVRKPLR
jgi:SAM-dependent methyltransferase